MAPRPGAPLPTAAGNSDDLELQGGRRTRREGISLRCPKRATNEKNDGTVVREHEAVQEGKGHGQHEANERPEDADGRRDTAPDEAAVLGEGERDG